HLRQIRQELGRQPVRLRDQHLDPLEHAVIGHPLDANVLHPSSLPLLSRPLRRRNQLRSRARSHSSSRRFARTSRNAVHASLSPPHDEINLRCPNAPCDLSTSPSTISLFFWASA